MIKKGLKMQHGKGIFYMLLACGLTAPMFSIIKWASSLAQMTQIIFFHYAAALVVTAALLLCSRPKTWVIKGKGLFSLRALFWLVTTACIFKASALLPVVHASLLLNTAPLIVPLFAFLFLREQISLRLWGAIAIAFAGTALVLGPTLAGFESLDITGVICGAIAALASAGSMVSTQRLASKNSALLLSFYLLAIGLVAVGSLLPFSWEAMPFNAVVGALASGSIFAVELYCFTKAFAHSAATRLGPFNYAGVVISGLVSWLVWGDKLDLFSWLGIALVCVGGSLSFLIPSRKTQTA